MSTGYRLTSIGLCKFHSADFLLKVDGTSVSL